MDGVGDGAVGSNIKRANLEFLILTIPTAIHGVLTYNMRIIVFLAFSDDKITESIMHMAPNPSFPGDDCRELQGLMTAGFPARAGWL